MSHVTMKLGIRTHWHSKVEPGEAQFVLRWVANEEHRVLMAIWDNSFMRAVLLFLAILDNQTPSNCRFWKMIFSVDVCTLRIGII